MSFLDTVAQGWALFRPLLIPRNFAIAGGAAALYAVATAFRPSPRITAAQIGAEGGAAFVAKSGRLIEYFLHGRPLAADGSATVVVAFHGAQTTGKLFALLDRWAIDNNVTIVAPTLPGFGLTPYAPYTVAAWTDDVIELLASLRVTRFHVVGTSLGSIHAAALATLYRPSSAVGNVALYVAFAPAAAGALDPLEGSVLKMFGTLRTWPYTKRLLEKFMFMPMLRLIAPRGSDVQRSIRWQWEGMAACADVIYAPWTWDGWRDLAAGGARRVLVISGTRDVAAPPHNQRFLHAQINGSELVEFEGAHERPIAEPALLAQHFAMLIAPKQ